jgi:hypothetical protein
MYLWKIFYFLFLVFLFFFGIKKISELTDKLVVYHIGEPFWKRVINVLKIYSFLGVISFFVMYLFLTMNLVSEFFIGSFYSIQVIAITIFSSSILTFVTRLGALSPSNSCSDHEKHCERIASFNFSLLSTFLFTLIIFLGINLYLNNLQSSNIILDLGLDRFIQIFFLWGGLLFSFAFFGELILTRLVPAGLRK